MTSSAGGESRAAPPRTPIGFISSHLPLRDVPAHPRIVPFLHFPEPLTRDLDDLDGHADTAHRLLPSRPPAPPCERQGTPSEAPPGRVERPPRRGPPRPNGEGFPRPCSTPYLRFRAGGEARLEGGVVHGPTRRAALGRANYVSASIKALTLAMLRSIPLVMRSLAAGYPHPGCRCSP